MSLASPAAGRTQTGGPAAVGENEGGAVVPEPRSARSASAPASSSAPASATVSASPGGQAAPATSGGAGAPALRIEGVSFGYPGRRGAVTAVDDVSFTVPVGGMGVLVGPSGCGKSTLLRLVAGLLEPTAGTIDVAGVAPAQLRRDRRAGFAFQDPGLLSWRSVRRNIELPFDLARLPKDPAWVDHLLEITGLADWAGRRPRELSGGMRQRVALARALATRPDVLLLDEPFGALDEITRADLNFELLRIVSDTATTCLLVTHSVDEAVLLADTVVVLGPRPCSVHAVHDVPVPRADRRELRDSAEFAARCRAIRADLEAAR
ncbi:ABC transporter ATP-binding protein [Frankia sp. CNm7]|uniref:ABC transporter ATP-binding protein n=1 Tax=Frankia nepalensis TaxID=1836974 RepID=A0A937URL2_9ACTN|nr:ABC transporter ATP-binding protein [Frankia nepalensis]MBL7498053.1 ABC transporter ATP-binding protein [Frankia nepalensis]MBL7516049.1 ABC transporter ATP-binding protein [Frankia nepalensis]MBL7518841.1 ABC transporter ATP-binding protein [Frankia nepalensis]MBL7629355.1 ABC transporter ATP-binding protein [Frankia nepalensis]